MFCLVDAALLVLILLIVVDNIQREQYKEICSIMVDMTKVTPNITYLSHTCGKHRVGKRRGGWTRRAVKILLRTPD